VVTVEGTESLSLLWLRYYINYCPFPIVLIPKIFVYNQNSYKYSYLMKQKKKNMYTFVFY